MKPEEVLRLDVQHQFRGHSKLLTKSKFLEYRELCFRTSSDPICLICYKPVLIDYCIIICDCSNQAFECKCGQTQCSCRRYPTYHQKCFQDFRNTCIICN